MYKNVIFDKVSRKLYERVVGSLEFVECKDYKDFFYADKMFESFITTQNKLGKGIKVELNKVYKDCFGSELKKCVSDHIIDNKDLRYLKPTYAKWTMAESDIGPVVRYIHSKYDNYDLGYNEHLDYRIAYYDIETQTGRPFPLSTVVHLLRNKNNPKETLNDITIYQFEHLYDTKMWEVYDEETKKFVDWRDSKYIAEVFPDPNEAEFIVNLITVYSTVDQQTHTWGLEAYTGNSEEVTDYRWFETEKEMFSDFVEWFSEQHFDILTGWNSEKFDDVYIHNRIAKLFGEDSPMLLKLSPIRSRWNRRVIGGEDTPNPTYHYTCPGLYMIDYMNLYKFIGFVKNSPSWKLDYIGKKEVGEGKVPLKWGITEHYIKDYNTYVEYNVQDVRLMVKIEAKKQLWPTAITYANEALITLDRIFSMTAAHDGYIMKYLHAKGLVYPDLRQTEVYDWWREEGHWKKVLPDGSIEYQNCPPESNNSFGTGEVKAGFCYSEPGRYQHCMSSDITSSYPNHLIMYNISPETVIKISDECDENEIIKSELNHVGFKRTEGAILPSIALKIFNERLDFKLKMQEAEKSGDQIGADRYRTLQLTRKKLINSLYGACLYKRFHLFNLECARSITRCARVTIRFLMSKTDHFYRSGNFLLASMEFFPVVWINGKWYKKKDKVNTDNGEMSAIEVYNNSESITIDGKPVEVKLNDLSNKKPLVPIRKIDIKLQLNVVSNGEYSTLDPGDTISLITPDGDLCDYTLGIKDAIPTITNKETKEVIYVELDTLKGYKIQKTGYPIDFINVISTSLAEEPRNSVVIQADTDSNYYCFDEHYINHFRYLDDMTWFYCMEEMMNQYWEFMLNRKAKARNLENRIIFTRENMFSHFISYGKKMYLGTIVDKDGKKFGYSKDLREHLKIQGLILKKAEFPIFCQEHATKITTDILFGKNKEAAIKDIKSTYKRFSESSPEEICANRTVGDLSTPSAKEIYVDNKGVIVYPPRAYQSIKIAVNFNIVNEREKLGLNPLSRGTKAKYLFIKPINKYGIDVIGFETWPDAFNELFKIDYCENFEKFFLSTFGSLFYALKWHSSKKLDVNEYAQSPVLKKFFSF